MTRPARITVNNGDISWESQLNTNLQQLYDTPIPILLHADTLADLQSTYAAASYEWCMAIVDYDGGTTPGSHLAFSNGTAWKLASNWEFINRRTFRGITSVDAFGDTDETIVVTGSGTFALTLPAIADSNEGRVCRVKNNGTGEVTVTPTGGDTIDGAGTRVTDTQYDALEFISDGTSNWQIFGASGAGGAADFLTLTDTPSTYASQTLKAVRVNAGETALEFYTAAAGVTDFTDLGDVPASYSGEASKTVKVNAGETALEFVDVDATANLGNPLKHLCMARTTGTETLTTSPGAAVDLPTELSSSGTAITWVSGTTHFLINETGNYLVSFHAQTQHVAIETTQSFIYKDTGGGFAKVDGPSGFEGGTTRTSMSSTVILPLNDGDKLQLWMASTATGDAREGTNMTIAKLEASIADGGDMECFQQGLDAAETSAFAASMTVVDLQSNIINNATDLYTYTAGTDVVTLNKAGLYMISYTIVADETSGTLETAAKLQKDIGAGYVDIAGSESSGSGADQFTHGNTVLVELAATDEIKLMAQYTTSAGNAVAGTMLRIVRLKRGSDAIDYEEDVAVDTGRKWIDGKTIWRKVITTAGAIATGGTGHAHSISSFDRCISLTGFVHRDDAGTSRIPINFSGVGAEVNANINDTQITLFINAVYTGAGNILSDLQAVIEYTI